jgi:two-component system invasion response regulator UvrY
MGQPRLPYPIPKVLSTREDSAYKHMIRVLIADDHAIVRTGVRHVLSSTSGVSVAGEASTAQELFTLVRKKEFDVVLLDITLPDKSGLEVIKELKRQHPDMAVLVFTMHPEDLFGMRALRAGATGYLTKENAPTELVKAIRKVAAGRRYMSSVLAEQLALPGEPHEERPPHLSLSDREYQVIRLLASGKAVTEIAQELSLSVKTVSTYRTRILEKMGMRNNAELIQYAIRNRLVD